MQFRTPECHWSWFFLKIQLIAVFKSMHTYIIYSSCWHFIYFKTRPFSLQEWMIPWSNHLLLSLKWEFLFFPTSPTSWTSSLFFLLRPFCWPTAALRKKKNSRTKKAFRKVHNILLLFLINKPGLRKIDLCFQNCHFDGEYSTPLYFESFGVAS